MRLASFHCDRPPTMCNPSRIPRAHRPRRSIQTLRNRVTAKSGNYYNAISDSNLIQKAKEDALASLPFSGDDYQSNMSFSLQVGILPSVHVTDESLSGAAKDFLTWAYRSLDTNIGQAEDGQVVSTDLIDWSRWCLVVQATRRTYVESSGSVSLQAYAHERRLFRLSLPEPHTQLHRAIDHRTNVLRHSSGSMRTCTQ